MGPQHIIDVCEANWDANKGDCNHFVKAVADALGVALFSAGDNADAIMDRLSGAAGWSMIPSTPDLSTVENDAASGQFIIAGLKSGDFTPPRNNGHVVVVVKGDDPAHPGYPMAYWGKLNGTGEKNSSIRNSFIPGTDLPNVKYYGTSLPETAEALRFSAQLPDLTTSDTLVGARTSVESLISTLVTSLGKSTEADDKHRLFFPNGIDDIEIEVKAGPMDVKVKVAGPKSSSSVS